MRPIRSPLLQLFVLVLGISACGSQSDKAGLEPDPAGTRLAEPGKVDEVGQPTEEPVAQAIFLNREGGLYDWAYVDDPQANASSVLYGGYEDLAEFAMDPLPLAPDHWNALLACVQGAFAPYDIEVTEQEPASADHIEVVLTGQGSWDFFPEVMRGVAPATWTAQPRAVVFVFGQHPDLPREEALQVQQLCWTAVHEVGHAFGLQHELPCDSPMHPLGSNVCTEHVQFSDRDCSCADLVEVSPQTFEVEKRSCWTSQTQNAHRELLDVLGPG